MLVFFIIDIDLWLVGFVIVVWKGYEKKRKVKNCLYMMGFWCGLKYVYFFVEFSYVNLSCILV